MRDYEFMLNDTVTDVGWKNIDRPGYFGKRRDEKIAALNTKYGEGYWRLRWLFNGDDGWTSYDFLGACVSLYEESYFRWFQANPKEVDFVCSYGECIDNGPTNVASGGDYTKQENNSTHIQDIAVRNVLRRLGRKFEGPEDRILVIRTKDDNGYKYGPGNIPFFDAAKIIQPSKHPWWAEVGSVEDLWQSNKYVQVRQPT